MSNTISRRSIAKGTAWSVPAVAVASASPAIAASATTVGTKICSIDHGYSGNSNYESSYKVYLGFDSTSGVIPKGTTLTYSFTLGQGTASFADSEVPALSYSPNAAYTLTSTPAAGTVATSFTVTMTFNQDTDTSNSCGPFLVWNSDDTLRGGTQIGFSGSTSGGSAVTAQSGSLVWQVGKRYGTSGAPQKATKFMSKSGSQACYPNINYTYGNHSSSSWTTCGDGNSANDTSTTYPDGTCQKLALTTGSSGVVSKC